jgi:hypothetical protein
VLAHGHQRTNAGLISVTPSAYLNSRQFVNFVSKVFADGRHHVAPTELWNFFAMRFYKDASPTGFEKLNPCLSVFIRG